MTAPDGYVYVKVETGVSDDDYIAITSGLTAEDTVAYDSSQHHHPRRGRMYNW